MTHPPVQLYGLLDCNSFFASCEKLFRPDLKDKAVVVLSNNDGVVVARSPEAKKLDIPMGEPYFKIKRLAESRQVVVFSSNYRLYGDMSNRIMKILQHWTPNVDIYSIDEAFLDLTLHGNISVDSLMNEIVSTVTKWTGIPVSLGVGSTMTLAKVANELAKKSGGTCVLLDPVIRDQALAKMEVGEIWGIGRRLAPKLVRMGFRTAKDLAAVDPLWIRKNFTIVQERLVRELNGEPCLDLSEVVAPRKNIQVSRSFSEATNDYRSLTEAVSTFAARACEKARSEGTAAAAVYIHLNTSWYKKDASYVSDGKMRGFNVPTSNSPEVIHTALALLREIYREGVLYKKASVMLLNLQNAKTVQSQGLLFDVGGKNPDDQQRDASLMDTVDRINRSFGRGTMLFGSQGIEQKWRGASEHCSPNYTISFIDLPVAKAK
ncbi:MAG: Y-family DNA polymerase [Planctomycetaceae bacterium]|jgi:DNA polymerase V|nr:Y-family DNA polymerase [Planctomycetaceae bacterium]